MREVAIFQRGHDLPKSKMKIGNIPVAGSNGVIGYHNTATTKAPGVTIGRSGNIGLAKFYENDFWAHNTTLYIKDFLGNDERFIFYMLSNLKLYGFNSGSAVPTLNRNYIHELNITCPPLPEQKAIAEVLSSLDDKIDLLHRQNKTLEDMAQTLFRHWFVENSPPKGMGSSGKERELSYFGDIICGKTPSKRVHKYFGGNFPFIKIPDMHGNNFVFDTLDTLTEEGKNSQINKTLPPKSICVSCIATVGLVSMNAFESQTNQQINSIIPKKEEYRYFIYLFMKSSKNLLESMASGGTATMNLNTANFSKISVLMPEEESLLSFHNVIKHLFDKIFYNHIQIRTLENLRDTLLPKLMRGDCRIHN